MTSPGRCIFLLLALLPLSVSTFDCFDTLCIGTDDAKTTIPCDQSTHVCIIGDDGLPKCDPSPEGGNGVDCRSANHHCSANATGSAICVYDPWTCYNTKCQGTGDQSSTFVDCDQSNGTCSVDEDTGAPLCIPGSIGEGVNCTIDKTHDEYYCQNDLTSGVAECVYPPKYDCYDTTCTGKEDFNKTVLSCDQADHRCSWNETGFPSCVNTTRGAGVDCDKDDEFYCSVDESGAGLCVVPANHTCYNTKCVGKSATIECNQTDHRCVLDADGEATCVNTTRGDGVDCSGVEHTDFYCSNDEDTGAAVCNLTPAKTCYNSKCVGTGEFNTTFVDCDQSANLCQVNGTGYPQCEDLSRGSGVNCTKDDTHDEYYCQNDETTGVAECVYPPKHDCYNTLCTGTGVFNTTVLSCDQTDHRCALNETGFPSCVNTTRGAGVDCKHTSPLDFYCTNTEVGAAQCVFTPPQSCYNQFCQGTGSKNTSWVSCDGAKNRCSVASDGSALCVPGSRGAGVNCNGTNYYCSNVEGDPFTALCMYPQNYSCYNTKCHGAFNYSQTYIGCDQGESYCGMDKRGSPMCIPDNSGEGVVCAGHFSCKADDGGVAACEKKSALLPLWIVLGVVGVVVIVVIIIWVIKRRSSAEDRQALLTPAFGN